MIDRRGIISFLVVTFGITYTIEGAFILTGLRLTGVPPLYGQLIIGGVMWVPTVATVLTIKLVTHEGFAITNLRIGALKPYLISALVIPACFMITYILAWLLGPGQPDWQLAELHTLMTSSGKEIQHCLVTNALPLWPYSGHIAAQRKPLAKQYHEMRLL